MNEKQLKLLVENHHPYCQETYIISKRIGMDWRCACEFLKAYDQWKREKKRLRGEGEEK